MRNRFGLVALFLIVRCFVFGDEPPVLPKKTALEKWYNDVTNRESMEQAARGHEIFICLVNVGTWEPEKENPRYARYELFADIKFAHKGVINDADFSGPAKLSRFAYGETKPVEMKVKGFDVACLAYDLLRNDFLSLPKQTNSPLTLFNFEDPYGLFVYLKVGDKSVFVKRDSFHDLCWKLHVQLQSMWAAQKNTPATVDSKK